MGKGSLRAKRERQEQVLACLRSESYWTGEGICDHLGINYRTLMRDLAELKEAGVPIRSERGRGGGISIAGRWGVSRLQLSNSEVITLLVSLAITENLRSPILAGNIRSIRNRISSAFPPEQQKVISKIRKRIMVGRGASDQVKSTYGEPRKSVLGDLNDSFFNQTKIKIRYRSASDDLTERVVELQYLYLVHPVWYFLCWDDLRGGARFFRIDRIVSASKTNISFKVRKESDLVAGGHEDFQAV